MTTDHDDPLNDDEGEDRPLSFIQPRETQRVVKARSSRHTSTVGWLRIGLPVFAVIVLVSLVLWPMIRPNTVKTAVIKNIPDLVIDNLHFTGLDSKNEPYSLTALKATRPSGAQNLYDLDEPEGEITLANGAWVDGKSLRGRYDQDGRRLWLGGNVQVFHDKGYQFTTEEAQVNLNENYVWGVKPVLIQGNFGVIRGQGFRLLDSGHIMIVTGPAHAVLNLRSDASSDKPAESKP